MVAASPCAALIRSRSLRTVSLKRLALGAILIKGMKNQDDDGRRTYAVASTKEKGRGPDSAGQSGDTQGLSDVAEADSESGEELVEDGQSFEAGLISGVEGAPDPDVAEVHAKQVPEDDVPSEYRDKD
jgi:hypothetical protein